MKVHVRGCELSCPRAAEEFSMLVVVKEIWRSFWEWNVPVRSGSGGKPGSYKKAEEKLDQVCVGDYENWLR